MLFSVLVETSRRISETSRRLEKIDLLANLLRPLAPGEIEAVVAWLSGNLLNGRAGIGLATLREASAPPAEVPTLEVSEVQRTIEQASAIEGAGTERRKRELMNALMARATSPEQDFLFRLLLGELRQGALEGVMLEGLAKAFGADAGHLRRAAMITGSLTQVARLLRESGPAGLDRCDVQLFRPVQPMLAQTADGVESALGDLGEAALEFKLDGARIQVHRSGDRVMAFSRALNDVTAAVPEVVDAARALPGGDLIVEGEVLSLTADGRPQPFQITMRRFGRKLDLERMRKELPLTPFWFDLLYAGQPLLDQPQQRRFGELRSLSPAANLIPHTITANQSIADEFLKEALAQGHEGIMAKAPAAGYAAGARGQSWLKIKRAHTLDLVLLAAEWGHGRRKGFLSNLHLGARDTEKGGFAMLGKTFKGLTDEMLAWQTEELLKLELGRDGITVYVQPKLVAEIAFNDIQMSPHYPAGLALRFARVKRYRGDKTSETADTLEAVRALAARYWTAETGSY
jgi:DNA ligase-1